MQHNADTTSKWLIDEVIMFPKQSRVGLLLIWHNTNPFIQPYTGPKKWFNWVVIIYYSKLVNFA